MSFKLKIALLSLGLTLACGRASAQFTVPEARPEPSAVRPIADTVRSSAAYDPGYYSRAREVAERRLRRKQRNNFEVRTTLQLTQTQFDNWAVGGDNTFSGKATLFVNHKYTKEKLGFEYKVEARYGLNHIDSKTFKNEDEFKLNFETMWQMHRRWSYAATANLRSQFSVGHKSRTDNTRISNLMAPGFLKLAVGVTYKEAPFSIILSPVGGSGTFVLDDELSQKGMNGVPPGDRAKWQVGPSVQINFDKRFAKNTIRIRSEVYSFTNIKTAPTVRWETTCDIQATKYLSTTLYGLVYYDKMASTPKPDHVQCQYSIGVGLAYTFKNK